MSKYTTEVRFLCESLTGHTESVGFNDTDAIITAAAPIIFSFDFPIFDTNYKLPLERKILRHYYTREISEETYGLWKLRLEDRLNVIMPYYNQLYQSALLSFNPFYDVDLTTEHTGNENDVVNSDSVGTQNRNNQKNNENSENVDEVNNKNGNNYEKGNESRNKDGTNDNVKITAGGTTLTHTGTVDEDENKTRNITNSGSENENNSVNKTMENNGEYEGSNTESNSGSRDTKNSGSKESTQWDLFSDTPQGGINGLSVPNSSAPSTDLENNLYLTTARKITDSETTTGNSKEVNDNVNVGSENNFSKESGNENTTENRNKSSDNVEVGEEAGKNTKTYNESNDEVKNESENNTGSFAESDVLNKNNENGFEEVNISNIGRNIIGKEDENEAINTSKNDSRVSTSTEEYLQRVSGKSGGMTYSAMLMEYRETFINIDEMIIEELSDLFFGLW